MIPGTTSLSTVLSRIPVRRESDQVYARVSLKNLLRNRACPRGEQLLLAGMELASNLHRHAGGGELLVLEGEGGLSLAALDRGPGIINPALATARGFTSLPGSLGLGLHSLERMEDMRLSILSQFDGALTGSAILLAPRAQDQPWGWVTSPLDRRGFNGDFGARRGDLYLIGDALGHGEEAARSAAEVLDLFRAWDVRRAPVKLFVAVDERLRGEGLRGAVMALAIREPGRWRVWGVGNIAVHRLGFDGSRRLDLPAGILGESFSHLGELVEESADGSLLVLTSDGIQASALTGPVMARFAGAEPQLVSLAVYNFFRYLNDDCSILTIRSQRGAT